MVLEVSPFLLFLCFLLFIVSLEVELLVFWANNAGTPSSERPSEAIMIFFILNLSPDLSLIEHP